VFGRWCVGALAGVRGGQLRINSWAGARRTVSGDQRDDARRRARKRRTHFKSFTNGVLVPSLMATALLMAELRGLGSVCKLKAGGINPFRQKML
jgi:hypothetical protein